MNTSGIVYILSESKIIFIYQYNVAVSDPRLSSTTLAFVFVSQIRIKVPLALALATSVPNLLIAKQVISPWWAFNIFGAVELVAFKFEMSYKVR